MMDKQASKSHLVERQANILSNTHNRDLSHTRTLLTTPQTLPERGGTDTVLWKQSHGLYFPDWKLVDKNVSIFGDWVIPQRTLEATEGKRHCWNNCWPPHACFTCFGNSQAELQQPWSTEQTSGQSVGCCCSSRRCNRSKATKSWEIHYCLSPPQIRPQWHPEWQVSWQVPHILYQAIYLLIIH